MFSFFTDFWRLLFGKDDLLSIPVPPEPPVLNSYELPSPGGWLDPEVIEQLSILKEDLTVLLDKDPVVWKTTVADTNSLATFIDYGHTVVLIAGANEKDH